jgi:hypothetical protein
MASPKYTSVSRSLCRSLLIGVASIAAFSAFTANAQTTEKTTRVDVPDGAPQLARETVVSDKSTDPKSESRSVIESTERVQGRLASERVTVGGGQSYLIVDPNAGKIDRASVNNGRRTVPSQWELFRF